MLCFFCEKTAAAGFWCIIDYMNEYFLNEIRTLFPDEYDDIISSFSREMYRSIRINRLKCRKEELELEGFDLKESTPFDPDSCYITTEEKLGNHPFHNAGCYYLQEPSAAMAVNVLRVEKGDLVADLCRAPGGKSTQILNRLDGTGLLWSNEINWKRCQILLSNLERWGYQNYVLTSLNTREIASMAAGLFDKVLVDAPCSGASMFKKYPDTVNDYNEAAVKACQKRQLEILENAYQLLKSDGVLVYSTCTFNLVENEETVYLFLQRHPDMQLEDAALGYGHKGLEYKDLNSQLLARVLPTDGGEGHFAARMRKTGSSLIRHPAVTENSHNGLVDAFLKEYGISTQYFIKDNEVYACPMPLSIRKGVIREGILLGTLEKNRFEPHHHLFMCPQFAEEFRQKYEINDRDRLIRYMKGESVDVSGYKGYVAISYKGKTLGFAKGDGRQLKNRLPKGLRNTNVL